MRAISLLLLPCVALALTTTTQGPRLAATSPAASRRSVGPLAVEAEDPLAKATCTKKAELVAEYREKFANPYEAAARGYVDAVILPADTRAVLIDAFDSLENKRDTNPPKKHGNIPL